MRKLLLLFSVLVGAVTPNAQVVTFTVQATANSTSVA